MSVVPDPRRRAQLLAALGFLRYPPRTRALAALHQWLDNWSGIGLVVVGMERHGYTVSIRQVADRWVASTMIRCLRLLASDQRRRRGVRCRIRRTRR